MTQKKTHEFEKLSEFDRALRHLVTATPEAVKSADEKWHKDRAKTAKKKPKK